METKYQLTAKGSGMDASVAVEMVIPNIFPDRL
jgi:hypothetical protein